MPARKPYTPMGQQGAASAAGGPQMPGLGMPPQAGRTGPQLSMPMAGNSRPSPGGMPGGAPGMPGMPGGAPQPKPEGGIPTGGLPGMPGMDELPLPMGPGGPTSPLNAQSQGMLRPDRQPRRVPMAQEEVFGQPPGGAGAGMPGGPQGAPGQMQPDVMMKLMKMLQGGGGGAMGGMA